MPLSEILNKCQISPQEFSNLTKTLSFESYLRVYEIKPGHFCVMSRKALYELIDGILIIIGQDDFGLPGDFTLSLDQILAKNDRIIPEKYSKTDIEFALKYLADFESGKYQLNRTKMFKSVAIRLLDSHPSGNENEPWRMQEYLSAVKAADELSSPAAMLDLPIVS